MIKSSSVIAKNTKTGDGAIYVKNVNVARKIQSVDRWNQGRFRNRFQSNEDP